MAACSWLRDSFLPSVLFKLGLLGLLSFGGGGLQHLFCFVFVFTCFWSNALHSKYSIL